MSTKDMPGLAELSDFTVECPPRELSLAELLERGLPTYFKHFEPGPFIRVTISATVENNAEGHSILRQLADVFAALFASDPVEP